MLLVFALSLLIFALFGLFILIILNADKLGYFLIPCFCLYVGFLSLIPIWIYHRRELLQIHAYLGDEAFYARYPKEKKRMLRQKAFEEKLERFINRFKK